MWSTSRENLNIAFNCDNLIFRLTLSEEVVGLSGCTFTIEAVPKTGFAFTKTGNKLETGVDFR